MRDPHEKDEGYVLGLVVKLGGVGGTRAETVVTRSTIHATRTHAALKRLYERGLIERDLAHDAVRLSTAGRAVVEQQIFAPRDRR